MKVAVFSTKSYDRQFLEAANLSHCHELVFFEPRLGPETAPLAQGCQAVCVFINDRLDAQTLHILAEQGVRLIALRAAGFNNVDLGVAKELGLTVVRVPAYSPYAVAEHAVALILALNRKIYRAYNRVRDDNFALEGLMGFDLHSATVGIIRNRQNRSVFCADHERVWLQSLGLRCLSQSNVPTNGDPLCRITGIAITF